ncbi:hypothetical protein [Oxalicibacterium solurbis]|uniref:hypothetical protein n=1 Tax=Oxalicibacterium solurbis TaxID=69280 RepID=UPI001E57013C|nr:hypothetical protein [Oxalicibacterium solurbis]
MAEVLTGLLGRQRALRNTSLSCGSGSGFASYAGTQTAAGFRKFSLQIRIIQMGRMGASSAANVIRHMSPNLSKAPLDCGLSQIIGARDFWFLFGGALLIVIWARVRSPEKWTDRQ